MSLLLPLLLATAALAEIVVSANDGKQVLDRGQQVVPATPKPDTVSIMDWRNGTLRIKANVAVPTSVIGPPRSVLVTPDGRYAIVTAARRLSPGRATIDWDDAISVVDIARARVISTIHDRAGASGIAIDRSGTRVLVANRADGSVSLFGFETGVLRLKAVLELGHGSSPAQPAFFDGDRRALVTRDGDHRVTILTVSGETLRAEPVWLAAGLRPYAIDVSRSGAIAVVGAIGGGGRDVDTISLIDLSGGGPRVVDSVAVGLTPEGLKLSPDGRYVAVTVNHGSNAEPGSATYHRHGLLQLWAIDRKRLVKVTQVAMGGWGQGVAWSADGRRILAQAMQGNMIESFTVDRRRLTRGPTIQLPAGPAAIATAEQ